MRTLNFEELNEVQGGGLATQWAGKIGNLLVNIVTVMDIASRVDTDALINDSAVNHTNTNAMGDHTQES
mgnify:CR=1 FL=1|jgi:hypothetical protein